MIHQPRVLWNQKEGLGERECSHGDSCRPGREFTLRLAGTKPDIFHLSGGGFSKAKTRSLLLPTRRRIPVMAS